MIGWVIRVHKRFIHISQNCFQQKSSRQVGLLPFKQTIGMKLAFLKYFLGQGCGV